MQIIPDMQRDSIYKTDIKYLFIFVLLVIYESISSIYLFLSPLFGVAFYLILFSIRHRKEPFLIFLSFLYILIYEIDKGFIPFSFLIFFLVYYKFIFEKIEHLFVSRNYRIFFHVLNGYIGYYLLNVVLDYLFNYPIISIDYRYIFYIFVDFLILVIA